MHDMSDAQEYLDLIAGLREAQIAGDEEVIAALEEDLEDMEPGTGYDRCTCGCVTDEQICPNCRADLDAE